MKTSLIAAVLASLLSLPAMAQINAASTAATASTASSLNAGNAQAITFNSEAPSATLRNVPSLGGNGFFGSFSPDNCMVSGGGTVAVAGFGGSVVTPIRDPQCSLLRTFERTQQAAATVASTDPVTAARLRQAATDMLCQVSDEARAALAHQGLCSDLTRAPAVAAAPVVQLARATERLRINQDGTVSRVK